MGVSGKQHSADLVIVLLLFFLYVGSALALCVLGAHSYSNMVTAAQEGFNQRTGILYLTQSIHQNDVEGGLRIDSFKGSDALVLMENEIGEGYETWIFVKDGYLCEQLIRAGDEIVEDQAQQIIPMQEIRLSVPGKGLLRVSLTTETGATNTTNLFLRSSAGLLNGEGSMPYAGPATSDGG